MNQFSGWVWVTRGMKLKPAPKPAKLRVASGQVRIAPADQNLHMYLYPSGRVPMGFKFAD